MAKKSRQPITVEPLPHDLLTTNDIARMLAISRNTVHEWLRAGKIPGAFSLPSRERRMWRIRRGDLDQFIENLRRQAAAEDHMTANGSRGTSVTKSSRDL
jgi:excisionase family DNA binding protein